MLYEYIIYTRIYIYIILHITCIYCLVYCNCKHARGTRMRDEQKIKYYIISVMVVNVQRREYVCVCAVAD